MRLTSMDCETCRFAVSARLDREPPRVDVAEIDRHLDGCAECRTWRDAAHQLTRRARLTAATTPARPSAESLERMRAAHRNAGRLSVERLGRSEVLRALLLVVAVAQLAVTIPMLLFGSDDAARDLGAMDMALGVGLLVVVFRPSRAQAISPIIGTAAGLLIFTAVLEVIHGKTELGAESPHIVALTGWLLVRRIGWLTPPAMEGPSRPLLQSGWTNARRVLRTVRADFADRSSSPGRPGVSSESRPGPDPVVGSTRSAADQADERRAVA